MDSCDIHDNDRIFHINYDSCICCKNENRHIRRIIREEKFWNFFEEAWVGGHGRKNLKLST